MHLPASQILRFADGVEYAETAHITGYRHHDPAIGEGLRRPPVWRVVGDGRGAGRPSASYTPRSPAQGVLYGIVRDHFETFRLEAARAHDRDGLPRFIEEEFRGFLRCGFLAGGFGRRHRWADGTTQLLFEPVELLERLAALTPRPRINLLLYYGVLGARSAWRSRLRAPDAEMPVMAGSPRRL